jgi:hypothetical protein
MNRDEVAANRSAEYLRQRIRSPDNFCHDAHAVLFAGPRVRKGGEVEVRPRVARRWQPWPGASNDIELSGSRSESAAVRG